MYINSDPNIFFCWGKYCLLPTPITTKLSFHFLILSHLLLHATLPVKPAMPGTQIPPAAPQFLVLNSKHPCRPQLHSSHVPQEQCFTGARGKRHTQVQFLAKSEAENLQTLCGIMPRWVWLTLPIYRSDFKNNLRSPELQDATTQTKVMGSL